MTGDDYWQWVCADGVAHSSRGARSAHFGGDAAVALLFPVWDFCQRVPHITLKWRPFWGKGQVKVFSLAAEIFAKLGVDA